MRHGPRDRATSGMVNREFNDLWWRFVSSVSSFGRPLTVDRMFRSQIALSASQEQVRKELAGRYPKHQWPLDPSTAEPGRPGGRRGR